MSLPRDPELDAGDAVVEEVLDRVLRGEACDLEALLGLHPELSDVGREHVRLTVADLRSDSERAQSRNKTPLRTATEGSSASGRQRFGVYELMHELGRGGQGVVYLALDTRLARKVALKILNRADITLAGDGSSSGPVARLKREAEVVSKLDHPGICVVYEMGAEGGRPFIAMRHVEGETLARKIVAAREAGRALLVSDSSSADAHDASSSTSAAQRRNVMRSLQLVEHIARALHVAHQARVVHRDVKPANVMITPAGQPVILDFGLARDEENDGPTLTATGDMVGSPAYMSPEQIDSRRGTVDARTDVYSLGVVLYECLTLRRPFESPTREGLYRAILEEPAADPRSVQSAISRDLAVVLATALERDRARRYQTPLDFAEDLRRVREQEPILARPAGPLLRWRRWVQRNRGFASAASAAIVILIGGIVVSTRFALHAIEQSLRADKQADQAMRSATAAHQQELLATRRANDVLSLSASKDLVDLIARADRLWPAHPDMIDAYQAWLADARELIDGCSPDPERGRMARASLDQHKAKLAELRARALPRSDEARHSESLSHEHDPSPERELEFADVDDAWWHQQLSSLVANLEAFADPSRGLMGDNIGSPHGWGMTKRYEFATTIREASIDGLDAARRWVHAIAAIEAAPSYAGLELAPQLGLVPIGADHDSGLWEFAHLQSGDPAVRGADGRLLITEATGLVFVLIPAVSFWMGAQREDPNGRNYDPQALPTESPVHEVSLSAFFLSKYEMTQGQWYRIAGSNPSGCGPTSTFNGLHLCDLTHPVEQVSWTDCVKLMDRMGLTLPTEAQWECGCRGGRKTAWWTGETRETLRGKVNLADQTAKKAGALWVDIDDWPDLEDGWMLHALVGSLPANPYGLHEVHGNVWEWCRDGFAPYLSERQTDPLTSSPDIGDRVVRGGTFGASAYYARSAFRGNFAPNFQISNLGLRPTRAMTP